MSSGVYRVEETARKNAAAQLESRVSLMFPLWVMSVSRHDKLLSFLNERRVDQTVTVGIFIVELVQLVLDVCLPVLLRGPEVPGHVL